MDPLLGIAIYIVLWWLSLFMVLPMGVKSLSEGGVQDAEGHDPGAPVAPDLRKKAVWASIVAAVFWVIIFVVLDVTYYAQFRAG
jgi:predicted secreted protein